MRLHLRSNRTERFLLELKGERAAEGGSAATALTEMFAALSLGSLQKNTPHFYSVDDERLM